VKKKFKELSLANRIAIIAIIIDSILSILSIIAAFVIVIIFGNTTSKFDFDNRGTKFYAPNLQGNFSNSQISFGEKEIPIQDDFYTKIYETDGKQFIIELKPQQRTWNPFFIGILQKEQINIKCEALFAKSGATPSVGLGFSEQSSVSDKTWFFIIAEETASKDNSYYIICDSRPSILLFGQSETTDKVYCIKANDKNEWEKCKM
jgi:hypothetical protein